MSRLLIALTLAALAAFAQPVAYRVNTIAGLFQLGNDGPAIQAILGRPDFLAYDAAGLLYIADTENHMIRRAQRDGRIVAVAGSGIRGNSGDGGSALRATLDQPSGIAIDGNLLYFGDRGNRRVRVVNLQSGVIENYVGDGTFGSSGDNGPAGNARLGTVAALAIDNQGNLLIADSHFDRVRRVNKATGIISTFAGNGSFGLGGENGPATQAQLASPTGLAVDADGSVFISNIDLGQVMRVEPSGTIRRVAGRFFSDNNADGITATEASILAPASLAVDRAKRVLYIVDEARSTIREVDLTAGTITTTAGTRNSFGFTPDNQPARGSRLNSPAGLTVHQGLLTFSDRGNYRIRRISATGSLEPLAGRTPFSGDGGPATQAGLFQPGIAIPDGAGGLFIADTGNCVIRQVNRLGQISTYAGVPNSCLSGGNGLPARQTSLNFPAALVRDSSGNLYVAEGRNIRRIPADGSTVSTLASNLRSPTGLALDGPQQFLYVAESAGNRITRIELSNGSVQVFAGSVGGSPGFADNVATPTEARFDLPADLAFDRQGNLFVADSFNFRIRRIDTTGRVTTVAGNGSPLPGNDGAALDNGIGFPSGLALDAAGNIFFSAPQRIMQLRAGRLTTIAGDSFGGLGGDGGFGPQARFNIPVLPRFDGNTLLVTDVFNHRIRTLTPLRAASLTVLSGDTQSAAVSTEPREPLVALVRLSDGAPAPGIPVTFATSAGTLSATRVITEADGRATARLTMPATAGAVTVTATVEELPPVRFSLTANTVVTPTPSRPRVSSVISAGSFGAAPRIAPGTWMEIYGANFAANQRQWSGDDFTGTQAPTVLGGVRVTVAGRPAFLQLVAPGQINAQVPDGIGTGLVDIQVTNADGASENFRVTAADRAPALLAPPAFNIGGRQYVAALHPDGAFVGPVDLIPGAAFRPAAAGDRIVLYGIGFGATAPAIPSGQIVGTVNALPAVQITIGGQTAQVEYAGLAGGFVGLYQFNLVIPTGITPGDAPLAVSAAGAALQQSLVLTIRE